MAGLTEVLGWLTAAMAAAGCLYVLAAALLARRYLAARTPASPLDPSTAPGVLLIKPLHGVYPGMLAVLRGYCDQDYPGPVQIRFGVQDPRDPAAEVVRALQAERPGTDIRLIVDTRYHGLNRKVANLINIAAGADREVLVISDADIAVGPDYLRRVVQALGQRGVGAVTCLYVGDGEPAGSFWGRLGAMALSYGFLPNAVLGKTLGMAEPCFGSTIALTAATLAAIGGFEAFADHLADDYEIGRAVRGLGLKIAIPAMVVRHRCLESTVRDLVGHELRWGRTVRQIDPAGYAGSLITHPFALALIASALLGFSLPSLCLIFTTLAARIVAKTCIDGATGSPTGRWWLIPARDVLSFGVFIASFTVNTVGWQGRRFRVGRGGVLSHS